MGALQLMKTIITIPHDGYMLTIHEVIHAIELATNAKVIGISEKDGHMTFSLAEPEPSEADTEPTPNLCADCGLKLVECDRCNCCMACCDCDIPF